VQAVHAHVHGRTAAELGPFPAGTRYSADDPELMLWVHATLVWASLSAYGRFERALSAAEQEEYYGQMAVVAQLCGTPAAVVPPTLGDFREYFAAQLASDTIIVTPAAREVAAVILQAPLVLPMRVLAPAHRLATAAQLPPRLRAEYGLRWSPLRARALPVAARSLRLTAYPLVLAAARLSPPPRLVAA
jgi:uncharacterized protein (DUF2236 family)